MQMEHKVVEGRGVVWCGTGWRKGQQERAKTGATDERGERKTWGKEGGGWGRATDEREREKGESK